MHSGARNCNELKIKTKTKKQNEQISQKLYEYRKIHKTQHNNNDLK